jgi:aspartyl-tRNA(Asn)/glutamyl-tRNA(Gln) amidotransferase subunit A
VADAGVPPATDPADLGVVEASARLQRRELSATELLEGCLRRIAERDGTHSFDGDAESINAWARLYEDEARDAASAADERLSEAGVRRDGPAPALCGVPIGLKDLYAVAGHPLTASSRVLDEVPTESCDVWTRLSAEGMVLLGHLHTHEFALGGSTDQVGNPWARDLSAGGSSGGSAAALIAGMVPAATGTDTAGSLRIPSALCGTSTIKPTRGLVSLRGVVPLSVSLDHGGPMARRLDDCALLLAAMAGPDAGRPTSAFSVAPTVPPADPERPLAGLRVAPSPRVVNVRLDPDVRAGYNAALDALGRLGATAFAPPPPKASLDIGNEFADVILGDLGAYHRQFDDRRERYRPFMREWMQMVEDRGLLAEDYVRIQMQRVELTAAWTRWFEEENIAAVIEPTVPVARFPRTAGYANPLDDRVLILLTHYWNWTGFPVVALPAGVGRETGLPVSVSLIGPAGSDGRLLAMGIALQELLGVPHLPEP